MNYTTDNLILKRLQEHKEQIPSTFNVFGIFLYGSQNYSTEKDPKSDIDSKVLVIPSFDEVALRKEMTNKIIQLENKELIEFKDFRHFLHLIKKMNVNILEILFTDYFIVKPKYQKFYDELIGKREELVRLDEKRFVQACLGMMIEKQKAMIYPRPSTEETIEKYGFDGKNLSHLLRLSETVEKYIKNKPFKECLLTKQFEELLAAKRNLKYTKEQAIELAETHIQKTRNLLHNSQFKSVNKEALKYFDDFIVRLLKETYF